MTLEEFTWLEAFSNDSISDTDGLRTWFWTGTYPGPYAPFCLQPWNGIAQGIQFIQFDQINRLYGRHKLTRPVARQCVLRAIQVMQSPNAHDQVIATVRDRVRAIVDGVRGCGPGEREEVLDKLLAPWYILVDLCMEETVNKIADLCKRFVPADESTSLAAKDKTPLEPRKPPRRT